MNTNRDQELKPTKCAHEIPEHMAGLGRFERIQDLMFCNSSIRTSQKILFLVNLQGVYDLRGIPHNHSRAMEEVAPTTSEECGRQGR